MTNSSRLEGGRLPPAIVISGAPGAASIVVAPVVFSSVSGFVGAYWPGVCPLPVSKIVFASVLALAFFTHDSSSEVSLAVHVFSALAALAPSVANPALTAIAEAAHAHKTRRAGLIAVILTKGFASRETCRPLFTD
jgi:hypothetical protein